MTTTTPPAGMRFRDHRDVVWTGEHFVFYGIGYKTAAEMIANFPTRFTDDDHAPLMALKANNLEPAPPEPVERDATWKNVRDLVSEVSADDDAGHYARNDRRTDTILRAVRGERASVMPMDRWVNVYPDGGVNWDTTHATEAAARGMAIQGSGAKQCRLAVLAEGAEAATESTTEPHQKTLRQLLRVALLDQRVLCSNYHERASAAQMNGDTERLVERYAVLIEAAPPAPLTAADAHVAALVAMGWDRRLVLAHASGMVASYRADRVHPEWPIRTALLAPAATDSTNDLCTWSADLSQIGCRPHGGYQWDADSAPRFCPECGKTVRVNTTPTPGGARDGE